MGFLKDFSDGHERLKKRIHSFRIPLSPRGQKIMSVVYFITPIVIGCFIMEWAKSKARINTQLNQAIETWDATPNTVKEANEAHNLVIQFQEVLTSAKNVNNVDNSTKK